MNAKGKVIATDLDGTLFFPKRRFRMLTTKNKRFLRNFIDEGGHLVIVSGRNHLFSKKVAMRLKRKIDVIGCNSAFIEVDGKTIKESTMENAKLCQTLEKIKERFHPTGIFLMTKEYNMIVPKKEYWWPHRIGYVFYQLFQGVYKEIAFRGDALIHNELKNGSIYKVMLFFGITKRAKERCMQYNKEMHKMYPDYEFAWCGELIEMTNKGCTKAEGIKLYLDYLKIKHDNVMVVGDSGNDISMFRDFQNSFCMSHASLHVSRYANHVIHSVCELEKYIDTNKEENYE